VYCTVFFIYFLGVLFSSVARPFAGNLVATPLKVFLPSDVVRQISSNVSPLQFGLAGQLNLVDNQKVQQPQFSAQDQPFFQTSLALLVVYS